MKVETFLAYAQVGFWILGKTVFFIWRQGNRRLLIKPLRL